MKYFKYFFQINIVVLAIFIFSCKKEENQKPLISISLPIKNTYFSYGDTIPIKASVSDDSEIKSVEIKLYDANNVSMLATIQIDVNAKEIDINRYLVIDNKDIESGEYFVRVSATDNEGESNSALQPVYINEMVRKFSNFIFFCKASSGYNVVSVNNNQTQNILKNLSNEYSYSYVSSKNELILYSGSFLSDLFAINSTNALVKWSVLNKGSSIMPYFSGIYTNEYETYVSLYSGAVQEYSRYGGILRTFDVGNMYWPMQVLKHDNHLVVTTSYKSGTSYSLNVFNFVTTNLTQSMPMSEKPVKVIPRNANELLLFANQGNQGVLNIYKYDENNCWQPHTLSGKFIDAVKIDENNYIISTSDEVSWYNYLNNSITPFGPAFANKIAYEDISGQVVFVKDNIVQMYSYPNNQKISEFAVADSIESFYLMYNR
ncbi:MAG: DUF4625 domain-containing protein [Bacteroidota bacterium]